MTLKDQIQAAENLLVDAVATGDSNKVIDLYTEDACLLAHGVPTL